MAENLGAEYWTGTVVCPRKALCHISHQRCLTMFEPVACHGCENKNLILVEIERDRLATKASKAHCKALSKQTHGGRGRRKKKDPVS